MRSFIIWDCSTINALFGQSPAIDEATLTAVLARMRSGTDAFEIALILTIPILEEVAGFARKDADRFRRIANTLWNLGGGFVLRPGIDRYPLEVAARAKLPPAQAFYTRSEAEVLRGRYLSDEAFVRARDEHAYQAKKAYGVEQRQTRKEALEALDKNNQHWDAEFRGWDNDRQAVIDEWVAFEMNLNADEYGLPADKSLWPGPREMPTLRYARAYSCARLKEIGEGRKCDDGGDLYDAVHFEDAAYADVLVTKDKDIIRRAETLALPGLRVVQPEEWAADILAGVSNSVRNES